LSGGGDNIYTFPQILWGNTSAPSQILNLNGSLNVLKLYDEAVNVYGVANGIPRYMEFSKEKTRR